MDIGLVYPRGQRVVKFRWVAQSFQRLGHNVTHIGSVSELAMADKRCDFVLFSHKGAGINAPDAVQLSRVKQSSWYQWWFDLVATRSLSPLGEQDDLGRRGASGSVNVTSTLRLMRAMDIVFVKERSLIADYRDLGIKARYLDQACPMEMPQIKYEDEPQYDVVVWGRNYPLRIHDAKALASAGMSVLWIGPSGPVPKQFHTLHWCSPLTLPEFVGRARYVLDVDCRHDLDGYCSDRHWMTTGMGAVVLRRAGGGGAEGWPGVCRYSDMKRLVEVVSRLLTAGHCKVLGDDNRRRTMESHTYENRCEEILKAHAETSRQRCV